MAPKVKATVSERERQIAQEIDVLEALYKPSEETGLLPGTAAADVIRAVSQVGRLRAEAGRIRAVRLAESAKDPINRLRSLGRVASSQDSWVAAQKYHRDAAALEIEREDLRARREAEVLEDVNDDDLVSIILDGLPKLPRPALARLLLEAAEALSLDLGPAGDTAAAEAEAG